MGMPASEEYLVEMFVDGEIKAQTWFTIHGQEEAV